ncbi:unnamed protein product [Cylicocyclus nassatus]|uniref:Uncharacterized protein n=1 Tax=Cylicocyclus nassatus TaxID=53992 RepID=A0AA36H8U5_CYLNA|nr:unnamed protein product [Cylicocyclus nassatus]
MDGIKVKIVDLFSCIEKIDGDFLILNEDRIYKILRDGRPKKPKALGSQQIHLKETRMPPAKRRHSPAPPRAPKAAKPTSSTATQSESSIGSATTEDDVERIARAVAVLKKKEKSTKDENTGNPTIDVD